jgi:TolB-like protein/DNA-binding winged helix-turn-helix (wHTH) protein
LASPFDLKVFSMANFWKTGGLPLSKRNLRKLGIVVAFGELSGVCMSAPASVSRVLRFDSFELDMQAGELRKRGVKLRLQGQPIHLLGILLQDAGNLVMREDLRSQLWASDTFVDFDHSLHNAVARIREVLGDSAEKPRYIETLPRRGYRFIAPVEEVPAGLVSPQNGNKNGHRKNGAAPVAPLLPPPKSRTSLILALCACCAIGLAAWVAWQSFHVRSAVRRIRSIAVLPLANLSGDPSQEYLADGMTEELITELSRIQGLKVISRTSVMSYQGTKKHLPQIASELGVDGIVEGAVDREGDQMRVTVQLLDAPDDRHLWSEDYQRPVRGILNLQREIAQAIAQQIRIELTPQQRARVSSAPAIDPEAYQAYLRGRFYLSTQFTRPQPLNTAKRDFEESIRKAPEFAPAYAGLADSYVYLAFFRQISPDLAYPLAKDAIHKALELDDSLGEPHTTLALLSWRYEWNWAAAERELDYAITLAPSDPCAHATRAVYLAALGRRAEALAEITRSRELDPGASFGSTESEVYYLLRDYGGLVEASRRGVASDPDEWMEHYYLGAGYEGSGKPAEAILEYQKAIHMSNGDQDATAALAHAYAVTGRRIKAENLLRNLQRKSKTGYVSAYMIATIYAGLGEKDKAFEFLARAYQERCLHLAWSLNADLRFDNLRSDSRFQALLRQINLPQ